MLNAEHIRWLLRELNVRTIAAMPGEQTKQVVIAQVTVENALQETLKLMEAPPPVPEKDPNAGVKIVDNPPAPKAKVPTPPTPIRKKTGGNRKATKTV